MDRSQRSRIVAVGAVAAVAVGISGLLLSVLASFVTPRVPDAEASFLSRHGHRCLEGVAVPDVEPSEAWRSHWSAITEDDCVPGSWLYQFRERGQNVAQYRDEEPNRSGPDERIVLAAMGEVQHEPSDALLPLVGEFVQLWFQRSTALRTRVEPPAEAWFPARGRSGQYHADLVLESLVGTCPRDAAACLAVTDKDLFVERLSYVFGLGHYHQRVGVFSTYRVFDPRRSLASGEREAVRAPEPLRRALKIAVHELGHEFSVGHCAHYRHCVMAGTNSMDESDAGSLMLCPLDHEKLGWNLRFDPYERFTGLADFAERQGLLPEARYWRRMARDYPVAPNAAGAGGL